MNTADIGFSKYVDYFFADSSGDTSLTFFFILCLLQGRMVIDGKEEPQSLIDMIIDTQKSSNPNNVIKFSDNSRLVV